MAHRLDVSWMKSGYKFHINVIIISTQCHIMFFATKILCNLFKVIRRICNHMLFMIKK
jgi:hypothetical protein